MKLLTIGLFLLLTVNVHSQDVNIPDVPQSFWDFIGAAFSNFFAYYFKFLSAALFPPEPVLYNPYTQKCCNGKAVDAILGFRFRCCGSGVYDSVTEVCCDGFKRSRSKYQAATGCCGNTIYNLKTSLCCKKMIVSLPDGVSQTDAAYYTCCGSTSIDSRKYNCCGGRKQAKTSEKPTCCDNKTEIFIPILQTCLKKSLVGNIYPDNTYPVNTYTDNTIISNASTASPNNDLYQPDCNGKAYDATKKLCCPPLSGNGPSILYDKPDLNTMCCGGKIYSTVKQTCCIDFDTNVVKILDKTSPDQYTCCGDVPYSYSSGICCNNKLLNRSSDIGCCGQTIFNSTTQDCCAVKVFERSKSVCCDYSTLISIGKDIDPKSASCCGQAAYDSTKKICCGQNLYDFSPGTECCNNYAYNTKTEVCCGLKPAKITDPSKTKCCINLPFPNPSQIPQCYIDMMLESGQLTEDNLTYAMMTSDYPGF